jgi:hypothetical protein
MTFFEELVEGGYKMIEKGEDEIARKREREHKNKKKEFHDYIENIDPYEEDVLDSTYPNIRSQRSTRNAARNAKKQMEIATSHTQNVSLK